MTSSFSTRASLDVVVDDQSMRRARDQLESNFGNVRTSLTADLQPDGGTSGGRKSGVRDLLSTQVEQLSEIRETLEKSGFSEAQAGGGGGGMMSGFALRGALSGTAGMVGTGLAGAGVGMLVDQAVRDSMPDWLRQPLGQSQNFQNTPLGVQMTNPVEAARTAAELIGRAWQNPKKTLKTLTSYVPEKPKWMSSLLSTSLKKPDWVSSLLNHQIKTPKWLSKLTNPQMSKPGWVSSLLETSLTKPDWVSTLLTHRLKKPKWLSRLTNPQISKPQWLSTLTDPNIKEPQWLSPLLSIFSGGGGGSGSGSDGISAGARIPNEATGRKPGFSVNVNHSPTYDVSLGDLDELQEVDLRKLERRVDELTRGLRGR